MSSPADLYGPSTDAEKLAANGTTNGITDSVRKRVVVHMSICDAIPAHGPISDMAFGIARNGVGSVYSKYLPPLTTFTGSPGPRAHGSDRVGSSGRLPPVPGMNVQRHFANGVDVRYDNREICQRARNANSMPLGEVAGCGPCLSDSRSSPTEARLTSLQTLFAENSTRSSSVPMLTPHRVCHGFVRSRQLHNK